MYSKEHIKYLKNLKREKTIIIFSKLFIITTLLMIWEILAKKEIINPFITSYPSQIIKTIIDLFKSGSLFNHIWVTFYETIISFSIATIIGIIIASLLYSSKIIAKILDPYLTVLNALPKVSLGPLIIIWMGANIKSIIFMAVVISMFTTIINMYTAFIGTDKNKIILLKSMGANKKQIFTKLVFRGNLDSLISTLKVSIALSFIGVIMGELLVSKQGLGYLITFGSQIFNLNLVITSIFILAIMAYLLYVLIDILGQKIK